MILWRGIRVIALGSCLLHSGGSELQSIEWSHGVGFEKLVEVAGSRF